MENVMAYIQEKWNQLTGFSKNETLRQELFQQLVSRHTSPNRFYHTLQQVANVFLLCEANMAKIENPMAVGLAILYHRVVYDTFKDDNAQASAQLAEVHLQLLKIKSTITQKVTALVSTGIDSNNGGLTDYENDVKYFVDFDLAILGAPWNEYEKYSLLIRKEFRQYPDDLYKPGRKNALQKLHDKTNIYLTSHFQQQYGAQARQNIFREIQLLS